MAILATDGGSININNATLNLSVGDCTVLGDMFGLVTHTEDTTAVFRVRGELAEVPTLTTDVVVIGDILYWDASNSRLTKIASTHKRAGIATTAKANGVATVGIFIILTYLSK